MRVIKVGVGMGLRPVAEKRREERGYNGDMGGGENQNWRRRGLTNVEI